MIELVEILARGCKGLDVAQVVGWTSIKTSVWSSFPLLFLIFLLHLCQFQFCYQEQPIKIEEQPVEF